VLSGRSIASAITHLSSRTHHGVVAAVGVMYTFCKDGVSGWIKPVTAVSRVVVLRGRTWGKFGGVRDRWAGTAGC